MGAETIRALLRQGPVRFVIDDVGKPLAWIPLSDCHAFWKEKVHPRLIEPSAAEQGVSLEELPGEYGYSASLWLADTLPVVLLRKWH
ncbi:hypothetical protein V3W47_07385 [Deinococcus sp. YIM 134068]